MAVAQCRVALKICGTNNCLSIKKKIYIALSYIIYFAATANMEYNKNVLHVLFNIVALNPFTSAIGDNVSKCKK